MSARRDLACTNLAGDILLSLRRMIRPCHAHARQASLVRRVKVTPRRNAGLYQKTGLASHSGLWASSEKGATPTNQTEEPDQSFDTALHCYFHPPHQRCLTQVQHARSLNHGITQSPALSLSPSRLATVSTHKKMHENGCCGSFRTAGTLELGQFC